MNTLDLHQLLSADPYVRRLDTYKVLAIDQLPLYINRTKPAVFIINTDPSYKPGAHWVGLFFDARGSFEYYDSFGFSPPEAILRFIQRNSLRPYRYNTRVLQDVLSDYCGLYAIHFVLGKARGLTLNAISSVFPDGTNQWRNDKIVYRLLRPLFHWISNNNAYVRY